MFLVQIDQSLYHARKRFPTHGTRAARARPQMLAVKVRLFLVQIDLSFYYSWYKSTCLSTVPGTKRTGKRGARRVRPPADAHRPGTRCLPIFPVFLLFLVQIDLSFYYSWCESTCLSMIPGTNRPVFRSFLEAVPQERDARPPADARRPGPKTDFS